MGRQQPRDLKARSVKVDEFNNLVKKLVNDFDIKLQQMAGEVDKVLNIHTKDIIEMKRMYAELSSTQRNVGIQFLLMRQVMRDKGVFHTEEEYDELMKRAKVEIMGIDEEGNMLGSYEIKYYNCN